MSEKKTAKIRALNDVFRRSGLTRWVENDFAFRPIMRNRAETVNGAYWPKV